MVERYSTWILLLSSVFYLTVLRARTEKPLINLAGARNVYRLVDGQHFPQQNVQISVALYIQKDLPRAYRDRLLGQLANTSKWLQGLSIKSSGYNVDLALSRVIETDPFLGKNMTYDNFEEYCSMYVKETASTVADANIAIIATFNQHIISPRAEYILGMSNNRNCMIYSVTSDDCGLVLFHELMHTVFKIDHIESCEKYTAGHVNVVAAQYQTYLCENVTHANLFSGLECDFYKDFENSGFMQRQPKNGSIAEWGAWSAWKRSSNGPFHIASRDRVCSADPDPGRTCASGERHQTKISIDKCTDISCVDRVRSLIQTQAEIRSNCSTYNGCLFLCDNGGTIVHTQPGTFCGEGFCDGTVCRMLDTLLTHKNSSDDGRQYKLVERLELDKKWQKTNWRYAKLLDWVRESRALLDFGPPVLRLNNNVLTCFGDSACQQAAEYLRANQVTFKSRGSSMTNRAVLVSPADGSCLFNEYVCEKYVYNYQYAKKFF